MSAQADLQFPLGLRPSRTDADYREQLRKYDEALSKMSKDEIVLERIKVEREMQTLQARLALCEPAPAADKDMAEDSGDESDSDLELDVESRLPPSHCIPIRTDVRHFDWAGFAAKVQFDVILMDPPWQLVGADPTRGVALGYSQLSNNEIGDMPIPQLQQPGALLFVWVINKTYSWTLDQFDVWGYDLIDDLTWVKHTTNRRLAKSHGFYLQHAKETCLVGRRRAVNQNTNNKSATNNQTSSHHSHPANGSGSNDASSAAAAAAAAYPPPTSIPELPASVPHVPEGGISDDIIWSERRGQSQKPEEIYDLIERIVPNGKYLEIFARRNNLRNFWVSIGLEL